MIVLFMGLVLLWDAFCLLWIGTASANPGVTYLLSLADERVWLIAMPVSACLAISGQIIKPRGYRIPLRAIMAGPQILLVQMMAVASLINLWSGGLQACANTALIVPLTAWHTYESIYGDARWHQTHLSTPSTSA